MENVSFIIEGEFLTNISRTLWADEKSPQKAIRLIKSAFPDMEEATVVSILTGKSKLAGNSSEGIFLEVDNSEVTENGNPLSLIAILEKMVEQQDELEDYQEFALGQTEVVPSEKGLIEVPRKWTTFKDTDCKRYLNLPSGKNLKDIIHRKVDSKIRKEKFFSDNTNFLREQKGVAIAERKPQKSYPSIVRDTGWLSPEGKFYPCAYGEHAEIAFHLGMPERQLEGLGWIKVQEKKFFWDFFGHAKPTQAQINGIFDYCTKKGIPMPSGLLEE